MFKISGRGTRLCDGITRREMLRIGGLASTGLTLGDVLRARAAGPPDAGRGKSVIMIWLRGGASHIDSYDMKPQAPAEIRGEFKPIRTNVPAALREIVSSRTRSARIRWRTADAPDQLRADHVDGIFSAFEFDAVEAHLSEATEPGRAVD